MKLYYSRGSCSLAAHIVAREAGVEIELVEVDPKTKLTSEGSDFTSINPKGYVPALGIEDGSVLTEVAAVTQFLADTAPERALMSASGTLERYREQEWLHFIGTELHKAWSPLFYAGTTDEQKQTTRTRLLKRLQVVERAMEQRPYLMGRGFTAPDAYLFTILRWARRTGVELPASLKDYQLRIAARAAVRDALRAEGLLAICLKDGRRGRSGA